MARIAYLAGCFALALVSASASAQSPGPRLHISTLPSEAEPCPPGEDGEVVVCAQRGPSPYRIDPDVLQAMRAKERAANPPRPPAPIAEADPCKVGPSGCPGEGAVDFIRPALVMLSVAVKAIQGEDWREPLRTGPDDYQTYSEEKAKRDGD